MGNRAITGSFVKTVISANDYNFNWTIENFRNLPSSKEVTSPEFSLSSNHVFCAKVIRKSDYSFKFRITFIKGSPIEITHTLYVSDGAGEVLYESSQCCEYSLKSDLQCLFCFDSVDIENAHVVNIKCVMNCCETKSQLEVLRFKPKPLSKLESLSALSTHLKAIYDTHLHTDVNFKVGDNILSVHKSIVCARSPVFAKMFETPMAETEKNVIEITDLEFHVLKDLVEFIYTGVLTKVDFESAYALFYAADKYDVSTLRMKCIDILLSSLTVENACSVLTLADQHSDVEFKKFVMDFIKFNFKSVQKTDAWSKLESLLSDKLMIHCSDG